MIKGNPVRLDQELADIGLGHTRKHDRLVYRTVDLFTIQVYRSLKKMPYGPAFQGIISFPSFADWDVL